MSTENIAPRKVEIVNSLQDNLKNHSTIGIVEMQGIGAKTVQKLRADLRDRATIQVAKNTLMKKAIELMDSGEVEGLELLEPHISGPVAFLFTNYSPYQIANFLDKNKVKAPAKAGQIAPKAVTIQKMNTGFPPGTIISELNSVGLPTRIEQGTVAIPEDTQILEKGDKVSVTAASIMSRLGIEPFEVGLSLDLVLEGGEIIDGEDLLVDFDAYRDQLVLAHQSAINLSVNAGILTTETAPLVISNAQRQTLSLAAEIGFVSKETASAVFGRAQGLALALARVVMDIDSSALSEEVIASATTTPVASAPVSSDSDDEEEEEEFEEEEEGEEVDEDLGSLFG